MHSLKEILATCSYSKFIGNMETAISKPITFDVANINATALMWVNVKNSNKAYELQKGTLVCPALDESKLNKNCNYIISSSPRKTFADILRSFFVEKDSPSISNKASIDGSVQVGKEISIGDHVVIQKNCVIGDHVHIGANTVIHTNTVIGSNVTIGANCTIGGVGFGYEKDEDGSYVLIPHIGNVVLHNNVEIGNNTAIDRAVMGSTILYENVKVDNLVHIAHGVAIGKNSLIIANSMIGGSTIIGENVWVAPSASLINKIKIEDNALIGMGAVVVKNVEASDVVAGNPAKSFKK